MGIRGVCIKGVGIRGVGIIRVGIMGVGIMRVGIIAVVIMAVGIMGVVAMEIDIMRVEIIGAGIMVFLQNLRENCHTQYHFLICLSHLVLYLSIRITNVGKFCIPHSISLNLITLHK